MNPTQNQPTSPQPQNPPFQPPQGSPVGANPLPQQGKNPQVDKANQAAASLSFATHLQTQMLQHQAPPPQQGQSQEGGQKDPNAEEEKKEPNISEELTKFKTEIEGLLDSKLGDLKREIETELSKEDDQETTLTKTA